jgi:hypothetical protein
VSERLRHAPYQNAAVVIAVAVTLACVFAVSYSLALGRPAPHNVPVALVGPRGARAASALEAATHHNLKLVSSGSVGAAERALRNQSVYAALVAERHDPRLLIASASGVSVARLLEQAAARASATAGVPLRVSDARPLPSQDPQGLVSFYVTIAATILGFVTMFQLRANASELSLRGWLGCIVVLAVGGGLLLTVVVDPLLRSLHGPVPELWAALAAQIATAALFNCAMLTSFGRWAMIPTWGLFIAIGNASSGGAVAPPLLPSFDRFVGRFLPNGATVETIRNAVYFRTAQHLEPILVETCWLLGALTLFLVSARLRGHTPATA